MTFKVYFSLILLGVTAFPWEPKLAAFIFQIVKDITLFITLIAGIYFGPHQISKVWKKQDIKES